MIVDATKTFLQCLSSTPAKFRSHLRHLAGNFILTTAYGIDIQGEDDPHVAIAQDAALAFSAAANAGTYLVDTFPVLKYLPAWFPGASFKRQAEEWRRPMIATLTVPFEYVKNQLVCAQTCIMRKAQDLQGSGHSTTLNRGSKAGEDA